MPGHTIRLHRMFRTSAERLYRACLDPHAMAKWLPPHGFTGKVLHLDAKVGGTYTMAFTNLTNGKAETFGGTYLELVPFERIVHTDTFDDPSLPGEMRTTLSFRATPFGTEFMAIQEGIPEGIPPEACHLGWQQSLDLLALLVEAEIPG